MTIRFPSFLPHPSNLALRALDALLRREDWAREGLAAHSGKSVKLAAGDWALHAVIGSDGLLQACDPAVVPDVTISIPADRMRDVPVAWRERGMAGVVGLAHIQGDAGLAHLVSDLANGLRWDVEDDLSRLVGDIMAVRLMEGARSLASGLGQSAGRARENLAEYLGEESGIGVRRPDFHAWREEVRALLARLDRLDARLSRFSRPEGAQ